MSKLTIRCRDWWPLCRNTLRGFAAIEIAELRMTVREVTVHESHGKAWAAAPSRPWVQNGAVIKDDAGKVQYTPLIEFDGKPVRDAFSAAVIKAVLEHDPDALQCREDTAA